MNYEYSRLSTPVMCLALGALTGCVAWKGEWLPDWLRIFLALLTIIFGATGAVTMMDWLTHQTSVRVRELGAARAWEAVYLAGAVKDLSNSQLELVARHDLTALEMIVGDEEPVFMVRCLTRAVPWTFVEEFLGQSKECRPYLWPVREASNREWAQEVTNLIIARGWAERASGPFAARLVKELEWVGRRFGVEI